MGIWLMRIPDLDRRGHCSNFRGMSIMLCKYDGEVLSQLSDALVFEDDVQPSQSCDDGPSRLLEPGM
jgi:hypothetical protein